MYSRDLASKKSRAALTAATTPADKRASGFIRGGGAKDQGHWGVDQGKFGHLGKEVGVLGKNYGQKGGCPKGTKKDKISSTQWLECIAKLEDQLVDGPNGEKLEPNCFVFVFVVPSQ